MSDPRVRLLVPPTFGPPRPAEEGLRTTLAAAFGAGEGKFGFGQRLSTVFKGVAEHWTEPASLHVLVGLFAVGVLILPFITIDRWVIQIGTYALIYALLAMGLNIVVGYAGLLDLGYVAFYAVGAYTAGIVTTRLGWQMWAAIPFVIIACVIAGIVIGAPTLRLRSDYLAIVTLGFGEIIRLLCNNIEALGGPSGIYGIPKWAFGSWSFSDGLTIGGLYLPENVLYFYFVAIIVLVIAIVIMPRLSKGKLGRAWKAVRDDEDAAEAMGINTYTTKLTAYIMGAVFGGFAGILSASLLTAFSPSDFRFLQSALVLVAVVIGGMGSIPGVVLGGLFVALTPEFLRFWDNRYLLFGILLLAVMMFRPRGLWPATKVLPWSNNRRRPPLSDSLPKGEP